MSPLRLWRVPRPARGESVSLSFGEAMQESLRARGFSRKHSRRWVRMREVLPCAVELTRNQHEPRFTDIDIYVGGPGGDLELVVFQTWQSQQAGRSPYDSSSPGDRTAFERDFHCTLSVLRAMETPQALSEALWDGAVRAGPPIDDPVSRVRAVLPIANAYSLDDWQKVVLAEARRLRATPTWRDEVNVWAELKGVPL